MRSQSAGTVVAACVVGLLAGLLQPFALAFAMVCVLGTVIAPLLFAWAGPLPALVYLAASLGSVGVKWSPGMSAAALLLFGVPSAAIIALMVRRAPFFMRLKAAVGAQLGAMLALILICYALLGRTLVDVLMESMTAWADGLPAPLVSIMLQQFALSGMMDAESAEAALSGALTYEQALQELHDIFDRTGEALRLGLPAMLLSSGLITGLLAPLLSGRLCARRGDDLEYVPLSGWFMPARLTIGLAVAFVTALALGWANVNGSEAVLAAITTAGELSFAVIGAAALSRRFRQAGRSPAFRAVMIVLGFLFAQRLLALIGIYSALMGRRGLISGYLRKKAENNDKGDDDL